METSLFLFLDNKSNIVNSNYITETERLILRKMEPTDAPFFLELNANPNVTRYTGDGAFKNIEEAETITLYVISQYQKYGFGRWLVIEKESNSPIGWCGLKYLEDIKEVDLGYRFLEGKWGKGYATEASVACLNYGFYNLNLNKIIGRADVNNHASINVFKKLKMSFIKTESYPEHDAVIYEVTKENHK